MIEIKNFGVKSSQFVGTEEELLADEGFQKLKQIYDHLKEYGECHVRVNGGDYDGSIARFTVDKEEKYQSIDDKLYRRIYNSSKEERYNVKYSWRGKLSWKGKRNNTQFSIKNSTCDVLLNYEGEEVLKRFDLKKEAKKLLENTKVEDIDGNVLQVGDKVVYMNLRYGCGGKLCHGEVKEFKAHARDGFVSIIVEHESGEEVSELRNPEMQIFKKTILL